MIGVSMGTLVPMFVAKVLLQPAYVCRSAGVSLTEYYVKVLGRSVVVPAVCSFAIWASFLRKLDLTNLEEVCLVVALQASVCTLVSLYSVFEAEDRRLVLSKLWQRRRVKEAPGSSVNVSLDLREL